MSVTLYYTPGTCSLAPMVALEWLGHAYTLCRVEKEARASDAYARVHPRRLVPALRVEPERVIGEVNAILSHLGGLPTSGPEGDAANQWLSYLASGFHAVFWPYFRPDRYTTEPAHEASVKAAAVAAIRRELAFVNEQLGARPFLLGERSVLDPYLHAMDRWSNAIVDVPKEFPHVFRHQKALATDPAVRKALAIERGDVTLHAHVDL